MTNKYIRVGEETAYSIVQPPAEWTADYFPTHVPDGYQIAYCYSTAKFSKVIFQNDLGMRIVYHVSIEKVGTQVNAENASCHLTALHAYDGYLYTMDTLCVLTWSDGKQFHTLSAATADIALDVVESLALIERSV